MWCKVSVREGKWGGGGVVTGGSSLGLDFQIIWQLLCCLQQQQQQPLFIPLTKTYLQLIFIMIIRVMAA